MKEGESVTGGASFLGSAEGTCLPAEGRFDTDSQSFLDVLSTAIDFLELSRSGVKRY